MVKFSKEQKAKKEADEMLSKFLVTPKITFSDLGGLTSEIKQLEEMIEWPLKYGSIFEFLGVRPPRGILISGPPGTGKTTLALAIAGQNPDIPLYKLNAPEIVSGLSGQSEEKIR
jgi:SpoVK/Ycf46/Vps4 family AAA+-type ATPase